MLKAEVDILMKCDHPNIVKMHKCYETDTILYLVLELLTGGELFDTIIVKVRQRRLCRNCACQLESRERSSTYSLSH